LENALRLGTDEIIELAFTFQEDSRGSVSLVNVARASMRLPVQKRIPLASPEPTADNISGERHGRGGDEAGGQMVVMMAPSASVVTLQDSLPNALSRSQVSRLRVGESHASLENRRATPNPSLHRHVSSDRGRAPRRIAAAVPRTAGRLSPHSGARVASGQRQAGPGRASRAVNSRRDDVGQAASARPRPGVADSEPRARLEAPRAAPATPSVDQGPAATLAVTRSSRPSDNINAAHVAARLSRSWVDATRRRGVIPGPGVGGARGPAPAASGRRAGGRGEARPASPAQGPSGSFNSRDPEYLEWFHRQRRRLYRLLRFPESLAVAFHQGSTVFRMRVSRDGTPAGTPRMIRSSGHEAFDQAAALAVRSALPFSPLPAELAPDMDAIPVTLSLEFGNPLIR